MRDKISQQIADICQELFSVTIQPVLSRPDEQFGDFATNVAMQLAKPVGQNPRDIANAIAEKLTEQQIAAQVAGPGFINITLPDAVVYAAINPEVGVRGGKLTLEYSCPNPFKQLHVGHLYQTILGDALARVHERLGTKVSRVTYGGDVGLHVARSMFGILQELGGENPENLANVPVEERANWLAKVYVAGTQAYEQDEATKQAITELNQRIYKLHDDNDTDSPFAQIYWQAREWSYDYFRSFYQDLAVKPFDRFIGESDTYKTGLALVRSHMGDVFEESEGAVILSKEKSGLHTRVFITSLGLPMYETKDLGVISLEHQLFDYDQRIIMTGNEQKEYMKVVFAAMKLIDPELGAKQSSLTHGLVKFGDGQKMSSRLGNVTRAIDVLIVAQSAVNAADEQTAWQIANGAVKYTFLKNSIGGDISFDLEQSISTEGNSGPYLQYALVRARSIMRDAPRVDQVDVTELNAEERRLAAWLSRYPEALEACANNSSLHELCAYLYELSQIFNRFYESNRVIDDPRSAIRIPLVSSYEKILSDGLTTLGIPTPEKM